MPRDLLALVGLFLDPERNRLTCDAEDSGAHDTGPLSCSVDGTRWLGRADLARDDALWRERTGAEHCTEWHSVGLPVAWDPLAASPRHAAVLAPPSGAVTFTSPTAKVRAVTPKWPFGVRVRGAVQGHSGPTLSLDTRDLAGADEDMFVA